MGPAMSKEDKLDELLKELNGVYDREVNQYRQCLSAVAEDLNHVLAQDNIRHLPIAARVKSWDSINGTARRRQKDRLAAQEIQGKMIEQKENWEVQFDRYKMDKDEIGYFKTVNELELGFHDMLGARIVLYFPSDTKRVLKLLKDAGYENGKDPKKMGGPANMRILRKLHAKWLDASAPAPATPKKKEPDDDLDTDGLEKQFSGYGAIHLALKIPKRLHPRDLTETEKEIWEKKVVEIQVGTVIMHAWAEVEHDITYKTHGREVTQDEKAVLDILNGLAIASEVGLRRFRSPPSSSSAAAEDVEELQGWMHQFYITKNRDMPDEWLDLDQLWDFLIKRNHNQRDKFLHYAEVAWNILLLHEKKEGIDLDHVFPFIMMHHHVPVLVLEQGRRIKAEKEAAEKKAAEEEAAEEEADSERGASSPTNVKNKREKHKHPLTRADNRKIVHLLEKANDQDLEEIAKLLRQFKMAAGSQGESEGEEYLGVISLKECESRIASDPKWLDKVRRRYDEWILEEIPPHGRWATFYAESTELGFPMRTVQRMSQDDLSRKSRGEQFSDWINMRWARCGLTLEYMAPGISMMLVLKHYGMF
ncbi:RelA_SpoT domain-containing protein [Trichoderma simmonsii]|uniref:RelA_SpoT domain-containing protein n=1 Tax=Trichoderma simmonsii TaxID=1491479 RepID=A0A8G0LPG9_9HYPO|nr:RelA_SpoT domain-containing protein [Trichoderma simmonsii]